MSSCEGEQAEPVGDEHDQGEQRGDCAVEGDQGRQQRGRAGRRRPAPGWARSRRGRCSQRPAQVVTPVESMASLTTKRVAMKMTTGSPKPATASSVVDQAGRPQGQRRQDRDHAPPGAGSTRRGRRRPPGRRSAWSRRPSASLVAAPSRADRGARAPAGCPSRYQATKKSSPGDQHDDGVRDHHRDHRAHAGRGSVALADQDDERQVDHQRRDHVDRSVPHPVGREHGLRRDPEVVEQRDEDGREDRPLGDDPGMIRSITTTSRMKPISSGSAPMLARLQPVGQLGRGDVGHVGVVEVRDELGDQQHQEDEAAEPVERLGDRVDDVGGCPSGCPRPCRSPGRPPGTASR